MSLNIQKIDANANKKPYTALLYCAPGVGKSTAIGLIAEASEGNTLVLDVDRTISRTLAKNEVVKDTSRILIQEIDNINTFDSYSRVLKELGEHSCKVLKENNIKTVAIDNISELERCILSDLGSNGNNKGVPAQADYQYMQFKLVNSLRYMKNWGVNIIWTAWEEISNVTYIDGSQYSKLMPKINQKIRDNVCGLCDVVGKIQAKQDGTRGIILEATTNVYAKNQIDGRKGCLVADFNKWEVDSDEV